MASATIAKPKITKPTTFRTPYDTRLDLVKNTITAHSKLDDDVAGTLAVEVLHALSSIPEKVR